MLMPKRVKFRRMQRGRMTGKATRGNTVSYGEYGLMALEPGWVKSNQIEAARIAMTRYTKRGGKVWIKIFPDKPITEKPAETRMGSGKGSPEYWVAVVKPGRVMFEIAGVSEETARPMLKCVNLIFGADGLQAVSTDSFRIASAKGDRESRGNISFLVPAASLEKLAALVDNREKLQVGTTGKHIVFTKEDFSFAARVMDGPYLAVSQVLSNLKQQFTVLTDAALLRDTILQALSVTGTQNRFSLSFAGNRLTVRCESEYGISETAMDVVALSGEPVGVYWYNPAQLMECLKALNGTLMLEVVQHSALLLKTDELVCFQMAVREPKAIETRPQKTKKPRKEAA